MPRAYNRHQQALKFLHFICSAILISANRRVGFISSLFFSHLFSFKLIFQHNKTYTRHLISSICLCKKVFHVLMLLRFSRGFFYQFYAFFLFSSFFRGKIPLVLVLGAVDFHLTIKQPFAINFHTTTDVKYAK